MICFYLVQADVKWEEPEANRKHLEKRFAKCTDGIIVLPEMFTTGFTMASNKLAETMEGETLIWMKTMASSLNSVLCGSQIIKSKDQYYNRFLWVNPAAEVLYYDKRHLFRMAGEHNHYSPGQRRVKVSSGKAKILPQVCYDLRFPAFCRNRDDYDILLFVANWPAERHEQWLSLLKARAIENLCYVIGVNRVGIDAKQVEYLGDSCVIDFRGQVLLEMGKEESIGKIELSLSSLYEYRANFPANLDADYFDIIL